MEEEYAKAAMIELGWWERGRKNTANSEMKFHFIPAKHHWEEVICDTQLLCQV